MPNPLQWGIMQLKFGFFKQAVYITLFQVMISSPFRCRKKASEDTKTVFDIMHPLYLCAKPGPKVPGPNR